MWVEGSPGMFSQLSPATSRKQRRWRLLSLAVHGLLLAWLLHAPEPQLLTPVSVALGENGRVLSRLYFPSRSPDDSTTSSSDSAREVYRHQRLGHEKLTWKPTSPLAKSDAQLPLSPSEAEDNAQTQTPSSLGHGAPAGLPYGTLARGATFGDEILPALPVTTSDPFTYPWELPESEGNVVVEITIDERGAIVRKMVLQSMGPKLDEKVLAALENWHFHPATRNGVPIASKQDAIFHFRARG
jgi:TonB family protein